MSEPTPLARALRALIAAEGPIGVGQFMQLCLYHPRHGYYMRGDPFGASGDFTTAPEISQMFGELLGLWAADVWTRMGKPARIALVELGPGRGTLMADALRAANVVPAFRAAIELHLVEISPTLKERQAQTLGASGLAPTWHAGLATLPHLPSIVFANEFFDALPASQFVRGEKHWHERVVALDAEGNLAFALAPAAALHLDSALPARLRSARPGQVFETRSDAVATTLAQRLLDFGGAALIIDYGYTAPAFGDTLQAVRRHRSVDVLEAPGEADLTAHVDFSALATVAEQAGLQALGPWAQGDFLRRLGIEARAARLKAKASPEHGAGFDAALMRLTGAGRENMGELFKALVLAAPKLGFGGTLE